MEFLRNNLKKNGKKRKKKWRDPEGLPKKEVLEKAAQLALGKGGKKEREELARLEGNLTDIIALKEMGGKHLDDVLGKAEKNFVWGVRRVASIDIPKGLSSEQEKAWKKDTEQRIRDSKKYSKESSLEDTIIKKTTIGLSEKDKEKYWQLCLDARQKLEKEKEAYLKPIKDAEDIKSGAEKKD